MPFIRLIAAWRVIVSLGLGGSVIQGYQALIRTRGASSHEALARPITVLGALGALTMLGLYAAVQLWRGRRAGRLAGATFFAIIVLVNLGSLMVRTGGAVTPAVIAAIALATLLSRQAKELTSG